MADAKRDGNYVTTLLAVSSVDGVTPVTLYANPTTHRLLVDLAGGGSGTVQTISIASANGFAGTSDANPSAPTLTLSTTVTGILKGNGTAISAVTIGTGLSYDGTTLSATGSGTGDVVGPASSTDNAVAVFDGLTGKLLENSTVSLTATALSPITTDTVTLGTTALMWSDLFLASGAVINFNNGNIVLTHAPGSLTLSDTNPGSTGPAFELFHDSVSPANLDLSNAINFYGRDSAANKQAYASIEQYISDVTSASEDGWVRINVAKAGTLTQMLDIGVDSSLNPMNGLTVGDGASDAIIQSKGNLDLILRTGNATTGSITIADGADGQITIAPNGNGNVVLATDYVGIGNGSEAVVELFADATDSSSFYLTASAGATLARLTDTSAGAAGPIVELYHNSASPAANDVVGTVTYYGKDSAANKQEYARIEGIISDTTSTSEDGFLRFWVTAGGAITSKIDLTNTGIVPTLNDGLALGSATLAYSDLFLAEGGVINWDNGDATITQSGNTITVAGITTFDTGTSTALTAGTIELGAATDTTISRVSAGVIAVEGNNVVLANTTATRSMVLTASGGNPTTTSGCASPTKVEAGTNDVDYFVLDFDAGTIEYAFWNVVLPDNYNGGTVTATFYWTAAAGAAGNVVWALQGRAYADDAAIDQAWGTAQEVTDAWIANGDVHISSATAAITLGGSPAGGQYAALRAYRNATSGSDTMTGDARLLSIKVEYTINAYTE